MENLTFLRPKTSRYGLLLASFEEGSLFPFIDLLGIMYFPYHFLRDSREESPTCSALAEFAYFKTLSYLGCYTRYHYHHSLTPSTMFYDL